MQIYQEEYHEHATLDNARAWGHLTLISEDRADNFIKGLIDKFSSVGVEDMSEVKLEYEMENLTYLFMLDIEANDIDLLEQLENAGWYTPRQLEEDYIQNKKENIRHYIDNMTIGEVLDMDHEECLLT
mgnify:FL=1|tara:strand:+ start:2107 stop:2490 length:384 start_codon:yes stop_codon:yes gene_type:complete